MAETTRAPRVDAKVPKGTIQWLVGRMHVGESDAHVRSEIERRAGPEWTPRLVKQAGDYAVWVHHQNRAEYNWVMGGGHGSTRDKSRQGLARRTKVKGAPRSIIVLADRPGHAVRESFSSLAEAERFAGKLRAAGWRRVSLHPSSQSATGAARKKVHVPAHTRAAPKKGR